MSYQSVKDRSFSVNMCGYPDMPLSGQSTTLRSETACKHWRFCGVSFSLQEVMLLTCFDK